MEEKHELFWNQGDFGYVKAVTDSMMPICSPEKEVRLQTIVPLEHAVWDCVFYIYRTMLCFVFPWDSLKLLQLANQKR